MFRISRVLVGATALLVGASACSGGSNTSVPLARTATSSSQVLDVASIFAGPPAAAASDATRAFQQRLSQTPTSGRRYILLANRVFSSATPVTYTSTGKACIDVGLAYDGTVSRPQLAIYDPTTGDLRLSAAVSATVQNNPPAGTAGPGTTASPAGPLQACFNATDLVPVLNTKANVSYGLLMYQDLVDTIARAKGSAGFFVFGSSNGTVPNSIQTFPTSNQQIVAEYPNLSNRFLTPGVTLSQFTNGNAFGARIDTNGGFGSPIANSFNTFGSPRIEINLVSPDRKTRVLAAVDSSQCPGNTPVNGILTFSAANCKVVTAADGAMDASAFSTKYGSYGFATPRLGRNPVQIVVDPYTTMNATYVGQPNPPASPPPASPNYRITNISLGL
ncbi:MAG: hypothetical protein M3N13_02290 [Candidatus Eremiobacteraeota bacterium]|nr:hypothetical protein [Candidatus Eremiobacteraeota bacterium]